MYLLLNWGDAEHLLFITLIKKIDLLILLGILRSVILRKLLRDSRIYCAKGKFIDLF